MVKTNTFPKIHTFFWDDSFASMNRLKHFRKIFDKYPEFELENPQIKNGVLSQMEFLKSSVLYACQMNYDYILVCGRSHKFTKNYMKRTLFSSISIAENLGADILLGGCVSTHTIFSVSKNVTWVDNFSGSEFVIIFKRFYTKILDGMPYQHMNFEIYIKLLKPTLFLIFPFISEFKHLKSGESLSQIMHNSNISIDEICRLSINKIKALLETERLIKNEIEHIVSFNDHRIKPFPTFIINLPERKDRYQSILTQFKDHNEFKISVVEAVKHDIGAVGLWMSIRKIVQIAIDSEEEYILIVEDDHMFTGYYNLENFLKSIAIGRKLSADLIVSGITDSFTNAIPVSDTIFWVDRFLCSQFVIIFRRLFDEILQYDYDESVTADTRLSALSNFTLAISPAISRQFDFGYSDVTEQLNTERGYLQKKNDKADEKFNRILYRYYKINRNKLRIDSFCSMLQGVLKCYIVFIMITCLY